VVVVATYDSRRKKVKGKTKTRVTFRTPVHPIRPARACSRAGRARLREERPRVALLVLARILAEWKLSGWRKWMGRAPKPDNLVVPRKTGKARDARKALEAFHEDLETLGLRERRHYDTRRTFISLALDGDASKDLLEKITHSRPQDPFDLYR
jgi:hypothetical protein